MQTPYSSMISRGTILALAAGLLASVPVRAEDAPATPAASEPTTAVSDALPPDPEADPFLNEEHFVMQWAVLGPFKFAAEDFGGEDQQPAATKEFIPNEADLTPETPAPEGTSWGVKKFVGEAQPGQVNLEAFFNGIDHAAAYAVAYVHCDKAMENLTLWTGSDDYITVWVNGKKVMSYDEKRRGSDWDQDQTTGITLEQGYNRIVVKVVDVVGGYDFYFRFSDTDDLPVTIKAR
ncbi:MAG: hypothetical protein IT442_06990 [Phycisphaeraceae bacterium]|nr:hypothetical protein [Phycisphaeraceae bacterium]